MKEKAVLLMLVVSLLVPGVLAWGVANPYIKEDPAVLKPGDNQQLTLELQNMEDDAKEITLSIENDSGMISAGKYVYTLQPMTREDVVLNAKVGKYTRSGNYTAVIYAQAKGVGEGSNQVTMTNAVRQTINIVVENKLMDSLQKWMLISLFVLTALAGVLKYGACYTEWKKNNADQQQLSGY